MSKLQKITEAELDAIIGHPDARVGYTRIHSDQGEPTTVTICVITLANGFHLVGKSACINPEDYDAVLGAEIAFRNAKNELWQLEGYRRMAGNESD